MPYRANPFLERMSERTSDQEFVRLFSPNILERLEEDAFEGAVHMFRSPPGGGKTTLLRAFTPSTLRAFWNTRGAQEMNESYQRLVTFQVLQEPLGPQVLGVLLSCASGYADLPPGATAAEEGLFRALLDCRIVLRSVRSVASLVGMSTAEDLSGIRLEYDELASELKAIPRLPSATELMRWAEQREKAVYAELDSMVGNTSSGMPLHICFESVFWLQSVRFIFNGSEVAPRRMLMIDDLHKLRRKQRATLIRELTEIRPRFPIWLAERSIALGDELLSQGTREGRDFRQYSLGDLWTATRGQHQFVTYAQNILDRRLYAQSEIAPVAFSHYLRSTLQAEDVREQIDKGIAKSQDELDRYRQSPRYLEWIEHVDRNLESRNLESLQEIYSTRILLARDHLRRQMSLELAPLSADELADRDSSQVQGAAEIFIHEEIKVPYYFGIERLCILATNNVEELLALAAALYDGLRAKQILRRPVLLSPHEQEKLLRDAVKKKRDFIPKNHTEGTRAQRLLDAIGSFCRERTFLPNAPYAPGVTGVRLSQAEMFRLSEGGLKEFGSTLRRVLAECVAENLLVSRQSAASTARDGGTVFYLNRSFCMHYGLPLQMGGWQDVNAERLIEWMERGRIPGKGKLLEAI